MFIPLSSSPPFGSPEQGTSWVSAWGIVDANSPLPCLCRGCVKIHQVQTGRETGSVICSGFQFSWSVLHSAVFVLFEGLVDQFKINLIQLPDLVTGLMSEVLHLDPEVLPSNWETVHCVLVWANIRAKDVKPHYSLSEADCGKKQLFVKKKTLVFSKLPCNFLKASVLKLQCNYL